MKRDMDSLRAMLFLYDAFAVMRIAALAYSTHTLTGGNNTYPSYYEPNGLPVMNSDVTIEGNGSTITRDNSAPAFRIFAIDSNDKLTLQDPTVSGGSLPDGGSGGVYNRLKTSSRLVLVGFMGGATVKANLGLLLAKRFQVFGAVLRSRPLADKIAITQRFRTNWLPLLRDGYIKPIIRSNFPMSAG